MVRRSAARLALLLLASAVPAAAAEEPRAFLRFAERLAGPPTEQLDVVAEQEVEIDRRALADQRVLLPLLDGRTYELVRSGIDLRPAGSFAWRGRLVDRDDGRAIGSATLTVGESAVLGTITTPEATYQILPAEGGGHRLALIDDSRLPPCGVRERSDIPDLLAADGPGPEGGLHSVTAAAKPKPPKVPPTTTLRLLVLATPGATVVLRSFDNLVNQVRHAVDLGNSAFANSQVPVTIELVQVLRTNYIEQAETYDDLQWVALSPEVADLRRQWGANQVVLVTSQPRTGGQTICGIADLMRKDVFLDGSRAPQGSSIVSAACATGYTLIHELGHTLGCEHDPGYGSPLSLALFPHAYGHFVDGRFRTIMSYPNDCTQGCSTIPHFSNPAIRFSGTPTGIAGRRDNSAVVRAVRGRFTGPPAGGCVPGPNTLCLGGRYQADVEWYDPHAVKLGRGKALKGPGALGLFSFGDVNSVDLALRFVDDGRNVTVSHAPLSGAFYEIYLRDLQTGSHEYYTWFGESGCGGSERAFASASRIAADAKKPAGGCRADATTVCLHNRFAVRAVWRDAQGEHPAGAVPLAPRNSGALDFGDGGDPELIVDIQPAGKKFNVAYAPLVARPYTLTITDTRTKAVRTYDQPNARQCGGSQAPAF